MRTNGMTVGTLRSPLLMSLVVAVSLLGFLAVGAAHPVYAATGGGCDRNYPALSACISEDISGTVVPDAWAHGPGSNCFMEIDLYEWNDSTQRWDLITNNAGLPCNGHFFGRFVKAAPRHAYYTAAFFYGWGFTSVSPELDT
jgi:hypothetical protein